ncbi:tyrosine-type recombinase/integrase [Mucilaginibacter ginsenosidivorax]|uniref:Site-specific integrase n=1 Tax=Mucilaginibacter ginsenosidivorax TaxID=862126 RepID=A0A5B8W6R6_9SPHI|nr:site-specific integrase [Mucilaginibacter ginsenosidivorax]QEC79700.1 site-specific integrase [Mucilaginibacter ginsenosidivorax]
MYTGLKIVSSDDLKHRSYIIYYFNGERCREYNGNSLNLKIFPNKASTLKEKAKLLSKLLFEIQKALEKGWNPLVVIKAEPVPAPTPATLRHTIEQAFKEVQIEKLASPLSDKYKREIKLLVKDFLLYLSENEKCKPINELQSDIIETYLNQFKATSVYYMSKRRLLAVFFAEFVRKKYIPDNIIKSTPRVKTKASLHKIYTKEQLHAILKFLKVNHPNLYLCALLSYGCLLRPHQEIRFLKKKHFNEDFSTISLSGSENKSARVRVVAVPKYLQDTLRDRLTEIVDPETNIFTMEEWSFNEYYFSMNWTRLRGDMLTAKILQEDQTIYSFRHTATVDIFKRTKDLHILQQLLGHSTMIVTLKYLRGLGELNSEELRSVLPDLELA